MLEEANQTQLPVSFARLHRHAQADTVRSDSAALEKGLIDSLTSGHNGPSTTEILAKARGPGGRGSSFRYLDSCFSGEKSKKSRKNLRRSYRKNRNQARLETDDVFSMGCPSFGFRHLVQVWRTNVAPSGLSVLLHGFVLISVPQCCSESNPPNALQVLVCGHNCCPTSL